MPLNDKKIALKDSVSQRDKINVANPNVPSWDMNRKDFRTRIMGVDDFGQTVFETENRLVLGGALFTLEKLFGVKAPIEVDYLNDILGIATGGPEITDRYPKENVVCLFGLGTGGAGDTIASVKDVSAKEREVFEPIPFRVTNNLTDEENQKYWFAAPDEEDGKTAYYLKRFEVVPSIGVNWADSDGDEDGTPVQSGVHESQRTEDIETYVDLVLRIDKKDCREWFEKNGEIERARFNSVGLFTGILSEVGGGAADYKQVSLFSKFNINNEMLDLSKGLTITYRIYTS